MTGQQLYELWQAKLLELQSCGSDNWDDLEKSDQQVWNAMALELPREG